MFNIWQKSIDEINDTPFYAFQHKQVKEKLD